MAQVTLQLCGWLLVSLVKPDTGTVRKIFQVRLYL